MQISKNSILIWLFLICFTGIIYDSIAQNQEKFVVVLDAGHGGKDPGRPTKLGYKEKDIALKIVLQIGELLEKNKDIKVIYTRKKDVFLELRERAAIANKADADLFISIHCNAHHTQAYGTETYVLGVKNTQRNMTVAKAENEVILLEQDYEKHYEGFNPNAPESIIGLTLQQEEYVEQSILLADLVEKNFKYKVKRKSRGVKQISLWVLHNTYMTSVLIETGFITNRSEGKFLNSRQGQQKISKSISDAIIKYKTILDQNVGNLGFQVESDESSTSSTVDIANENTYKNIVFKVQIAASSRKIEPKSYNFKGLKTISRTKSGKLYKYYYGYTSNYSKIKVLQAKAKTKGYKSSFIVAYKNGKPITLKKVLKSSVN